MRAVLILSFSLACGGAIAAAQPTAALPGSVLLFPAVNADPSARPVTVISVTNTNASRLTGPNRLRHGDVNLHYYYVDCATGLVSNRLEFLTPNDLLAVIAAQHAPVQGRGYLIVVAEDPESGDAIQYNYLIGGATFIDLGANRMWSLPAISFRGLMDEKKAPVRDRNGRVKTDALANGGNGNGSADFDGREYDFYPDELYLDSFLEERCVVRGKFCFVSGLSRDFLVQLDFRFYDNEEDPFSAVFQFRGCTCVDFAAISKVVANLGGDPSETPSGWARINGVKAINLLTGRPWRNETNGTNLDPPVIGALTERVITLGLETGGVLRWRGTQNGNEFPWDGVN